MEGCSVALARGAAEARAGSWFRRGGGASRYGPDMCAGKWAIGFQSIPCTGATSITCFRGTLDAPLSTKGMLTACAAWASLRSARYANSAPPWARCRNATHSSSRRLNASARWRKRRPPSAAQGPGARKSGCWRAPKRRAPSRWPRSRRARAASTGALPRRNRQACGALPRQYILLAGATSTPVLNRAASDAVARASRLVSIPTAT